MTGCPEGLSAFCTWRAVASGRIARRGREPSDPAESTSPPDARKYNGSSVIEFAVEVTSVPNQDSKSQVVRHHASNDRQIRPPRSGRRAARRVRHRRAPADADPDPLPAAGGQPVFAESPASRPSPDWICSTSPTAPRRPRPRTARPRAMARNGPRASPSARPRCAWCPAWIGRRCASRVSWPTVLGRSTWSWPRCRSSGFPDEPYQITKGDDERCCATARSSPATSDAKAKLQGEVQRRLAQPRSARSCSTSTLQRELRHRCLYRAELCHFLGREPVCSFFTWPASSTGTSDLLHDHHRVRRLRGRAPQEEPAHDRHHPGLEGLHILATAAALLSPSGPCGELGMEAIAPQGAAMLYKIKNLVTAVAGHRRGARRPEI